jgi:hypothetical protein
MEAVDRPILRNYLPLKLFLDDLETMERILVDSSSAVSFEAEGFRFSSMGELASKVKRVRLEALHIRANSPYVSIELTRLWAKLYVDSSQDKSAGIFYKLDQVLSNRCRSLKWLYSYTCAWTLNGVALLSNFIPRYDRRLSVALTSVLSIWVVWVAFIRVRRHSTIILKHEKERGSFIDRNRDNLAVAVISAVLGALVGIAGTMLVGYLKK